MSGFLKRLILILIFAAFVAGSLLLWRSPDPLYTLRAWTAGSRYWDYDEMIVAAANKHGLDPMLIKALVWRESAFQPEMVGTVGERGLMQVGEAAAQDWVRAAKVETFVPTDLFDARTNLEVGTWYLRKALERWSSKADPIPFALAEYNAGRTRVDGWIGATNRGDQATADDLMAVMDFPTTRCYIEDITKRYRFYQSRGRM